MKAISGILALFVSMPIWYYLLYQVLARVGATDVMWLLFWVYVPVSTIAMTIAKIAES